MQRPPAPADPDAAERLLERFGAQGAEAAHYAQGAGGALLRGLGGGSPFLADLAVRGHNVLLDMAARGPMPRSAARSASSMQSRPAPAAPPSWPPAVRRSAR